MERPAIPAEIRRAVMVEAGHRCAIPRCGQTEIDIHHIVPWEKCKKHEYANLIALCPVCHRRAHKREIDRKSLLMYKENLATEFGANDSGSYEAKIIEIKRRLSEENTDDPGYTYKFDFPDFQEPLEKIVSRNIEAWGYELLAEFRENQKEWSASVVEDQDNELGVFRIPSTLSGNYRVVRRDPSVISIKYSIDRYYTGAAHGGRTTRVQNYFLRPFSPIVVETLLGSEERLPEFSEFIRERLRATKKYDSGWLQRGTEPKADNFGLFNIEKYGLVFTFSEYQIDCYAAGEQELRLSFHELKEICSKEIIDRLENNDL